jgi:hypothetical protein
MTFFPEKPQIEIVREKIAEMQGGLSAILLLLSDYENTKCPDKGDAIICDVIDRFEDLEAHSNQAQNWARVI